METKKQIDSEADEQVIEDLQQELADEKSSDKGSRNFKQDKTGWVIFKNGKKKIKLRKHISTLALKATRYNEFNFNHNRNHFIEMYNKHGLPGVNQSIIDIQAKYLEEQQVDALKQIEELKKTQENETN